MTDFTAGQRVQYRRPRIGWLNATVIELNRKDLILRVDGDDLNVKIKRDYLVGDRSPVAKHLAPA